MPVAPPPPFAPEFAEALVSVAAADESSAFCILDRERRFVAFNKGFARLYRGDTGAAPTIGADIVTPYPEPVRAEWRPRYQWALEGATLVHDYRGTDDRRYELRIAPIHRADGETFLLMRVRDVSAMVAAESALRASEAVFRETFEHAPIGMAVVEISGQFSRVNRAFCELLGYSGEELCAKSFADVTHRDDLQGSLALVARLQRGDLPRGTCEKRYVRKDGGLVEARLHLSLVHDDQGAPRHFIAQIDDVTERRAMLEAVRASEKAFRTLVERSPVGILVRDGTVIRFANARLAEMFGFDDPAEMAGRDVREFVAAADVPGLVDRMARIDDGAHEAPRELRCVRRDGSQLMAETVGVQLDDWSPDPAAHGTSLVILHDISARVQAEQQREAAQEGLRRSLAEKEVLLREIHHRVKNNLQVISSLLRMQVRRIVDPAARALFEESAQRVRSLSLLHEGLYHADDVSRVDFDRYARNLVAAQLRASAAQRRVSVHIDAGGVALPLDVAVPCGLALNELLANAFAHAFPGDRRGRVEVHASREGREVVMRVRDDGVGFAGEAARAKDGVGLKLVDTLARQIHGSLSFEAAPHEAEPGTCCTLRFPSS